MMVQVLEADEWRVRPSSLQTGFWEGEPQTPERDSLLVFMMESALIDGSSLRDLQSTFMLFLRQLWKSPPPFPDVELSWTPAPSSMIHEHQRCHLTLVGLRSKTIRQDSKLPPPPQLMS